MFGRVFLSEKYKGTYSIGSKNQRIKIQVKEGRQKESKLEKKEFFGCGKSKE